MSEFHATNHEEAVILAALHQHTPHTHTATHVTHTPHTGTGVLTPTGTRTGTGRGTLGGVASPSQPRTCWGRSREGGAAASSPPEGFPGARQPWCLRAPRFPCAALPCPAFHGSPSSAPGSPLLAPSYLLYIERLSSHLPQQVSLEPSAAPLCCLSWPGRSLCPRPSPAACLPPASGSRGCCVRGGPAGGRVLSALLRGAGWVPRDLPCPAQRSCFLGHCPRPRALKLRWLQAGSCPLPSLGPEFPAPVELRASSAGCSP